MAGTHTRATRRAAPPSAPAPGAAGWRSRVHTPAVSDPKQRRESIKRAGSLIKTTAKIDTISLGRD